MSTILQNKEKPNLNEKNINNKEIEEKPENKEEKINPLSLLSKDLLEQINSLDEIDFGEKKDNMNDYMQLDETQKESEENEEEDDYILEVEKESEKDIFGFEIFKNEENDKMNDKNKKKENKKQGRLSQPIPTPQNINNFRTSKIDDSNFCFPIGRFSYDYPQYQNKNDSFNVHFNNPLQNQLNFFNNSFTMNGKSGWVCAHCKNFNYESKYIFINIYII
jgi:hypothetical protein